MELDRGCVNITMNLITSREINRIAVIRWAHLRECSVGSADKELVIETDQGRELQTSHGELVERATITNRIKILNMSARRESERERERHPKPYARQCRCRAATSDNEVLSNRAR